MTTNRVLYTKGNFQVTLNDAKDGYEVWNTDTGVLEHKSTVLYDCMRMANMSEAYIEWVNTSLNKEESTSPQLDLDLVKLAGKAN